MCLAIPGKIIEITSDATHPRWSMSSACDEKWIWDCCRTISPKTGRLGADSRGLRHEQNQRRRSHRPDAYSANAGRSRSRDAGDSQAMAWKMRKRERSHLI